METISFDHAGLVKLYQQGYFDADAIWTNRPFF